MVVAFDVWWWKMNKSDACRRGLSTRVVLRRKRTHCLLDDLVYNFGPSACMVETEYIYIYISWKIIKIYIYIYIIDFDFILLN